jgi:DNA repair exonuclease SbcCD ATPase subunit
VTDRLNTAVEALFRAPLNEFVAERKRLASELKASGDKQAATKLSQLGRPSVSAWAVNQLWWRQRPAFEALLQAAASVKAGDREASKQHREALAELRQHATALLEEAGNAASEATLRRITTTLSALAAAGGFAPDAPGALLADRDPPGFETFVASSTSSAAHPQSPPDVDAAAAARAEKAAEAARRRAEEAEREHRRAERERLSHAFREAQQLRAAQQREVTRLKEELDSAEQGLKQTQTLLAQIEAQLASL